MKNKDEIKDNDGGVCYIVSSDQGRKSCWFTTGDPLD